MVKSWPRYCQNTTRNSSEKLTFFCILLNLELQHLGSLWSTHVRPWALLSTPGHYWLLYQGAMSAKLSMVPWPWMLIITHEGCRGHDTILMIAQGCLWVLMSAQKCPWVLIIAHECSWHHVHAYSGLLMSIHEYSWALISSHEHSWAWRIGTMAPTAFISANKWWWAWRHGAITTHSALAQYFSVLKSAHKCPWALLSASEYSCAILRVQGVDSVIKHKMLIFKMSSF